MTGSSSTITFSFGLNFPRLVWCTTTRATVNPECHSECLGGCVAAPMPHYTCEASRVYQLSTVTTVRSSPIACQRFVRCQTALLSIPDSPNKGVQPIRKQLCSDRTMPSGSESEPLLNGELPVSSGAPQNGDASPASDAPSKPISTRVSQLRGKLHTKVDSCLKSLRTMCESPTLETYLGIALVAGVVCGLVAFIYSSSFEALLDLVWTKVPEKLLLPALQRLHESHSWWPAPGKIGVSQLPHHQFRANELSCLSHALQRVLKIYD